MHGELQLFQRLDGGFDMNVEAAMVGCGRFWWKVEDNDVATPNWSNFVSYDAARCQHVVGHI